MTLVRRVLSPGVSAGRRSAGERGETLVELLITVVILGIAFAALLSGLGTAIGSTRIHRQQANADTVMVSVADSVKSQVLNPYKTCNTISSSNTYNPTNGVTLPTSNSGGVNWASSNIVLTSVSKWSGTAWVTCASGVADNGSERVTITITTPGTPSTVETIEVVKRNPV